MSTIDYNTDNTEEVVENYYQDASVNSPTYPMYYCPLCSYSMRSEWDDLDQYDDDPGYRQRRRRRRRRRYPHYYPRPYIHPYIFPFIFPYYDDWD